MDVEQAVDELRSLYDAHLAQPFPDHSANDELEAFKFELLDYDGWVAGLASSILQGIRPSRSVTYCPPMLPKLESEHSDFSDSSEHEILWNYVRRLDAMRELIIVIDHHRN